MNSCATLNTSKQSDTSASMNLGHDPATLKGALRAYELVLDRVTGGGLKLYFNSTIDERDTNWSLFPRALSFVVTLITTIGYGNISPHTPWGRVFCIAYALLGIPLMLIVISRSGKTFATSPAEPIAGSVAPLRLEVPHRFESDEYAAHGQHVRVRQRSAHRPLCVHRLWGVDVQNCGRMDVFRRVLLLLHHGDHNRTRGSDSSYR